MSSMRIGFPKFLTRNIVLLSLISFFTDIASEMLFPILPFYMMDIGYGVFIIGLLEGLGEFIAGLAKAYCGAVSDWTGKRVPFIRAGYALAALSKPIIGITQSLSIIFAIKSLDRLGKGIRTAPRDAMLMLDSSEANRGAVFGFHRGMDTVGAILGPAISLLLLSVFSMSLGAIIALTLIPGCLAVLLTFALADSTPAEPSTVPRERRTLREILRFWSEGSSSYRRLLVGFTLLALVKSSEVFIMLRAKELGASGTYIVAAYLCYTLLFALAAFPVGALGDRFGFRPVYLIGILAFGISYGTLAFDNLSMPFVCGLFALYGLFAAAYEGVTKAWLSVYLDDAHAGTGIGLYLSISSFAFLLGSAGTGLLWQSIGSSLTFSLIALSSMGTFLYFALIPLADPEHTRATVQPTACH